MIQLLKMSYAAEQSGVEVETLTEWILEGSFPAVKVPKTGWMVQAPALKKWLEDGGKTAHQPGTFANSHELKLGSVVDESRDDADDDVGVVVPKVKRAGAKEGNRAARPQLTAETPQVNAHAKAPNPAQPVSGEQLPNDDLMARFDALKSSRCIGPEQYSLLQLPDIVSGLQVTEETAFSWFRSGLKPVRSKAGPHFRIADLERFLKHCIKRKSCKGVDTDLASTSSDEASPDASKPAKSSGPIAYWRPVTPHDPCSICLRRFRCSISKDGQWAFCGQTKSAQWMPGGYLHPGRAYLGVDVTEGWASLLPEVELQLLQPIWDDEAHDRLDWHGKLPGSVRHCCRAGLVRGNRASGEISQALKPCNSRLCPGCGRKWGRAVLAYLWSVWSRLDVIYWSPEFLIDNVGRVRDRIRKLADSQGAQYCLIRRQDCATVFATQPLRGRKEPTDWHALSPVDALEKLRHSLRLPELQLKFSTSEIGDWQLPHVHEPPDEEGETSSSDHGHQPGGDSRAATPPAAGPLESDSTELATNPSAAAGSETVRDADRHDNEDGDSPESTLPGASQSDEKSPDDADPGRQQSDRGDNDSCSDGVSFGFRTKVRLDKTLEEIWVQRAPEHFEEGVYLRMPPPGVLPDEFLRDVGRELSKSAELAPPPASRADEGSDDDD